MTHTATYRCLVCGTEYRPLDAAQCHQRCCGEPLVRVPTGGHGPLAALFNWIELFLAANVPAIATKGSVDSMTKDLAASTSDDVRVLEIITPRENRKDFLAIENLFGTLAAENPFSLEIAGEYNLRRYFVRGSPGTLEHVRHQIQAVYSQAEFIEVPPEQDPARPDDGITDTAKLKLARPVYLPLRTLKEGSFEEADPMVALLGAFGVENPGERVLSQLILAAAPQGWAKRYLGSARQIEQSMSGQAMTMGLYFRQFASVISVLVTVAACLYAFMMYLQHRWLDFAASSLVSAVCIGGVAMLYRFLVERDNVDPKLVQRKTEGIAFDVTFRLVAVASTPERAGQLLKQLRMAYQQFGSNSGNNLVAHRMPFDPRCIALDRWSWREEFTGRTMRLNVAELATLWHLPVDQDIPFLKRTQAKRMLPLPHDVERGILVGHSRHQGKTIPVHMSSAALSHHVFMVAKTQKGKSTLMSHLAVETMRQPDPPAVFVIDPHGDLARSVLRRVPPERAGDVVYVDFSDREQVMGLNLLDMTQGRLADDIQDHVVHTGNLIWTEFWGPRMEDALRYAVATLLKANEKLAQEKQDQFTLIDVPKLFELTNFRHRLIKQFEIEGELREWWEEYYETLEPAKRMEIINPVLTKIHRFAIQSVIRNVVGQSKSTVNLLKLLKEKRILIVNTAAGVIGKDASGLLAAVLIDAVRAVVSEQNAIPEPNARARVVVIVDEFHTITGVDYMELLAELSKNGASLILATQSLGQLRNVKPALPGTVLANIAGLFVFQTSAEDAEVLRHELGDVVTSPDITSLARYHCYMRIELDGEPLPPVHLETLPPDPGSPIVAEQIMGQRSRHTHPVRWAESERKRFRAQWFGRELNLLDQLNSLRDGQQTGPPKDKCKREPKGESKEKEKVVDRSEVTGNGDSKGDRKDGSQDENQEEREGQESQADSNAATPSKPSEEDGATRKDLTSDSRERGRQGDGSSTPESDTKPNTPSSFQDKRGEKQEDKPGPKEGQEPPGNGEFGQKGKTPPKRANP